MALWFAFLRGINLGKRQVRMAELKTCLEAAGFDAIKTVLASGNIRVRAEGKTEAIRARLETAIQAQFGFPVGVVLRSEDAFGAMLANHPFARLDPQADVTRHVLMFDRALPPGLRLEDRKGHTEILRIDPRDIYIAGYRQPDGRYTEGVEAVLKPLYAQVGKDGLDTMRNWNTIEKMQA
jgi:uncharacterized protein (DUF1697 family)